MDIKLQILMLIDLSLASCFMGLKKYGTSLWFIGLFVWMLLELTFGAV